MSDDPTTSAEVTDPTVSEQPDEPVEENDVTRLTRALEHEREERKTAKEELRRLREDEDAFREFVQQRGFQIDDGEEDEDEDEDDEEGVEEPRTDAVLEKRLATLEAERAGERFDRDLQGFAADRDVSEQGRDWITLQTMRGGNNKQALEKAVKAWFEFEDGLSQPKPRKKAPHVPSGGKTATAVKDWSSMTRDEINEQMVERVRALESQT